MRRPPRDPRAAARRAAAVDRRLDPDLFKALSDPTRAKLLACLVKCGRPCSVSEVAACCAVDFSVVARHLGLLARIDLLAVEKKGRTVWYHARGAMLAARLRALADAIDEWRPAAGECCATAGCCAPATVNRTADPARGKPRFSPSSGASPQRNPTGVEDR